MHTVLLPIEESRVVDLASQLSLQGKRAILLALVPHLDEFEALTDYGNERIRALATERGLDWESLSESERETLIDNLLHDHS
jgi:hypothetical protein